MSNKSQLQTNNTKVASLIEVLKTKGTPTGEEVTEETNAYTAKLETLETAITALENELDGKAGSGGASIETYSLTMNFTDRFMSAGLEELDFFGSIYLPDHTICGSETCTLLSATWTLSVIQNTVLIIPNSLLNNVIFTCDEGEAYWGELTEGSGVYILEPVSNAIITFDWR